MSISIQNLSKIYGSQKALDGVSFEVHAGEILGFLGPNGAGKSTTMKIITGLITADTGKVSVCGLDTVDNPLETRRKIGYLAEQNPLYMDMYVQEFLRFMGELSGIQGKNLSLKIKEMIEVTGLGNEQHKKISALSKGYKQRVGLAQALIHDPEVLILDEPTSGLDPNQMLEIREVIRNFGKKRTLIFSSHILPEVQAIADRVVIIHKGKIVADQSMKNLADLSGSRTVVRVEFENNIQKFDTHTLQTQFPDLEKISEGPNSWKFTSKTSGDLRKAIYAESVRQDVPILSLKKESAGLEELFRNLTGGETNLS